ncbi:MAG: GAF domain-containing protein [Tabrizicola sp.]|nr:GAF domain-containing protein [Tabrizicola sp.]
MARSTDHVARVMDTLSSGSEAARSRLAASWQRSWLKHGLDPSSPPTERGPDLDRLRDQRQALDQVLAVAAPKLDDLYAMIGHCGCGILLTDAQGLVLDARAGAADAEVFRSWGLAPGVDWSEAAQGTNGIGTCLAERRALTIHRDQHYLAENIGMSCIDAPVFGPDGGLIAALDVSSARADQTEGFNRLIEGMVARVAQAIEADLFRQTFPKALVIGATREARRRHGLEPAGQIRPRPVVDLLGREDGPAGLEGAERAAVIRALTRAGGNVSEAARALGLGRATLYRRMKRLGIEDRS